MKSYGLTKIKLKVKIGEMLVESGVITEYQLNSMLKQQQVMREQGENVLFGDLISSQLDISKHEIENIFAKYLLFSISQMFYKILRNDESLSARLGNPDDFIDRTDIYIPKWTIRKESIKEIIDAELVVVITPAEDASVITVNMPFEYIIEDQIANIDLPGAAEAIRTKLLKDKGLTECTDLSEIGIMMPECESATKILYVDDESFQCELMQKLLSKLGYEVETATGAEEALKILEEKSFQLVITDLKMPGMDGLELCEQIKNSKSKPVVYALSGYIASFGTDSIETAGFDGYLSKPVSLNNLRNAIEIALDKSKLDRLGMGGE